MIDLSTPFRPCRLAACLTAWLTCSVLFFTPPPHCIDGVDCEVTGQFKGEVYSLSGFEIHSTSEHLVNEQAYDAEIQFMHVNARQSLFLVVSVFLDSTEDVHNPWIEEMFANLERSVGRYDMTLTYVAESVFLHVAWSVSA